MSDPTETSGASNTPNTGTTMAAAFEAAKPAAPAPAAPAFDTSACLPDHIDVVDAKLVSIDGHAVSGTVSASSPEAVVRQITDAAKGLTNPVLIWDTPLSKSGSSITGKFRLAHKHQLRRVAA